MFQMLLLDKKGSFTIEATVVISFSFLIISAVMGLSFSLFNRCSIERAVVASALRGSEQIFENNTVRHQTAESAFGEVLQNNLLFSSDVEKEIEVGGDRVKVCAKTDYKKWTFRTQSEKKVINPVSFIRKYRKAKGVIKKNDAG